MKVFVVLALVAAATANPQYFLNNGLYTHPFAYNAPLTYNAAVPQAVTYNAPVVAHTQAVVAPVATKTQYHAQDELGQASFGYSHPGQARAEVRDAAGNVRGSYAYINPEGREIRVDYTAGHDGFRAASNALPIAPAAVVAGPAPVQDTPEVAAAKAQHFAAVAEAHSRQKRQVIATNFAAAPVHSYAYTAPVVHHTPAATALSYNYPLTYSAPVVAAPVHTPALTYAAAPVHTPALTYAAAPAAVTYAAAPVAVAPAHPVRAATLTKVVNTPGHAVSYRVD